MKRFNSTPMLIFLKKNNKKKYQLNKNKIIKILLNSRALYEKNFSDKRKIKKILI